MTLYNIVGPSTLVAGKPEDVSQVLANFQAIQAILNGGLDNSNINAAAAIARTKLAGYPWNDADIAVAAAIASSKLAGYPWKNADIDAAAAIVGSKLAGYPWKNADLDAAAAIAYSKLVLTGSIVNADINAAAAIALSKLATPFAALLQAIPPDPASNSSATPKMMGISWAGTTTTATGVNALNSAVVNVASTAGFPASGGFLMGGVVTSYTGVTGASFTGCGAHAATVGGEVITPPATLTPQSTRAFVQVTGDMSVTAGGNITTRLRYGTGNGPANGAAVAGTLIGNTNGHVLDLGGHPYPFTLNAIITGLAPATPLWFDLDVATDGAHAGTVIRLTVDAFDLI